VTVLDVNGRPLSNSPPVRLAIESGPGELPTGRAINFAAGSDIPVRDGQAAIAMRSWQAGISRIRATSPGLRDAVIDIRTIDGPRFVPGITPIANDRPYHAYDAQAGDKAEETFGANNPTDASSSAGGHASRLANDGDPASYWQAAPGDAAPWLWVNPERIVEYHRLRIRFPQPVAYGFVAETRRGDGTWVKLAEQPVGADARQERDIATQWITGGPVRIRISTPPGTTPGIAELRLFGVLQDH